MSRWGYFLRRLLLSIPVVVFGTTITFVIIRMGPIDPVSAIIGIDGSAQQADAIRRQLGLNQPLWAQYIEYMRRLFFGLFTGDLGDSWVVRPDTGAGTLVAQFAPRTVWLGLWSVLIALFVGIPLGFYAGLNPNTLGDYAASFGGIVWRAMPNFWLAVMLLAVLSQSKDFLFGFEWSRFLVRTTIVGAPPMQFYDVTGYATVAGVRVPVAVNPMLENVVAATKKVAPAALVLGSASMGNEMRIGRTAVLETINSNYVETAKAKGVTNRSLVWKHVFRNALIPLVPVITNEAFLLIGGSVIVETIFGINGLGFLFLQAVTSGDLPLVGSLMFIFIIFLVAINILQDFLYTVIDPRVGYET